MKRKLLIVLSLLAVLIVGIAVQWWSMPDTSGGWVKSGENPVLGSN